MQYDMKKGLTTSSIRVKMMTLQSLFGIIPLQAEKHHHKN